VKVWLLVEIHGDETEHVGLYTSPDAARAALSELIDDAPLNWLDGGTDTVTLAFVWSGGQAGDLPSRRFQLYPLEVEREEGIDDSAPQEMRSPAYVHRHAEVDAEAEAAA
jgi:hypothetical protein